MTDRHQALTKARDCLREVFLSHRDKKSGEYNECEKAECFWCEEAAEGMKALDALLASEETPLTAEEEAEDRREAVELQRAYVSGEIEAEIIPHRPAEETPPPSALRRFLLGIVKQNGCNDHVWLVSRAAELLAAIGARPAEETQESGIRCIDCGLPYAEHGLDITLPDAQWARLQPLRQGGGVLCGRCIAVRARRIEGSIAIRATIEGLPAEETPPASEPAVSVAGRFNRTLADFERACLVHLEEEQRRPNPDNALIGVLCDAVRLAREESDDWESRRVSLGVPLETPPNYGGVAAEGHEPACQSVVGGAAEPEQRQAESGQARSPQSPPASEPPAEMTPPDPRSVPGPDPVLDTHLARSWEHQQRELEQIAAELAAARDDAR